MALYCFLKLLPIHLPEKTSEILLKTKAMYIFPELSWTVRLGSTITGILDQLKLLWHDAKFPVLIFKKSLILITSIIPAFQCARSSWYVCDVHTKDQVLNDLRVLLPFENSKSPSGPANHITFLSQWEMHICNYGCFTVQDHLIDQKTGARPKKIT